MDRLIMYFDICRKASFIHSVILAGNFIILAKLQGLQYYIPENLRCNLKHYESDIFF